MPTPILRAAIWKSFTVLKPTSKSRMTLWTELANKNLLEKRSQKAGHAWNDAPCRSRQPKPDLCRDPTKDLLR